MRNNLAKTRSLSVRDALHGRSHEEREATVTGNPAARMAGGCAASEGNELDRLYGPLSGREWLDLEMWAFQELPRRSYAAFARLRDHHGVPIEAWIARRTVPAGAQRTRRRAGATRL